MNVSAKYPNLGEDASIQELVREALSSVGIVADSKIVGALTEVVEHFEDYDPRELQDAARTIYQLRENLQTVTAELEALKQAAPNPVEPEQPPQQPETQEPPVESESLGTA